MSKYLMSRDTDRDTGHNYTALIRRMRKKKMKKKRGNKTKMTKKLN